MTVIWQNAPAIRLESGGYDGITTVAELARRGSLGVGAFEGLMGEMVGVDGAFYQVFADSHAEQAGPDARLAFCMVIDFAGTDPAELPVGTTALTLPTLLDDLGLSRNLPYALRIDATFARLDTRCFPRLDPPLPALGEVVAQQPEYHYEQIEGTLIGYRSPGYVGHLSPDGHHLHFLSADRATGGHVLGFEVATGTLSWEQAERIEIEFPDGGEFPRLDLSPE